MRLLVDTNIFLEVILEQAKTLEAQNFLSKIAEHEFFASDYSIHSVGLLLFRRKQPDVFRKFLRDMVSTAGLTMVGLGVEALEAIIPAATQFTLDFDDAYQYVIAEQYGLTIVSFDADFDRTNRGRMTPDQMFP